MTVRRLVLQRLETSDHGTFGRMVVDGMVLFTGELPDRHNAPNVSCILPGVYRCNYELSPRFRRFMYGVAPVPGRAGVRIHAANFMGDKSKGLHCQLNGCIALGERLGVMDGQKAVLLSAPAIRRLETAMGHGPFELEVTECSAQS